MRLQTELKQMICALMLAIGPMAAMAQVNQNNPDQIYLIMERQGMIDNITTNQTSAMMKTSVIQNTIAAQFTKIRQWEGKYTEYLRSIRGLASTLKAGNMIYVEGVEVLRNIYDLKKAISYNSQGLAATICLSDIYLEVIETFMKVYTSLEQSVGKGGNTNMLNGSERSEMLWQLGDDMYAFNRKLRELVILLSYNKMIDVWHTYTAGLVQIDKGEIARRCMDRWERAHGIMTVINH